jgi:hypothetical protein
VAPESKQPGVLLIEIGLSKPLSRQKTVTVELAWPDMASLPLPTDTIQIDRAEVYITTGPADDDTILADPLSLKDRTWRGVYDSNEFISAQTFAAMVRKDRNVLSARIIQ